MPKRKEMQAAQRRAMALLVEACAASRAGAKRKQVMALVVLALAALEAVAG